MKRCKTSIAIAPIAAMVAFVVISRTSGIAISTVVPPTWAMNQANLEGRMSPGRVAVVQSADCLAGDDGAVGDHGRDHVEEVIPELEDPGTQPDADDDDF